MEKVVRTVKITVSLIVAFLIALTVRSCHNETPSVPTASKQLAKEAVQSSIGGKIFAFVIVLVVLAAIMGWVYYEHKNDTDGKWGKIIKNNATMTSLGLIVLNAIAYLTHYELWRKFYDAGILFWITNITIILFVYLIFEESKAAKVVAGVMALLVLSAWLKMPNWLIQSSSGQRSGINTTPNVTSPVSYSGSGTFQNVPVEVARKVVCECESGCKQFELDDITPLKNKGIPGKVKPSSAFGKYQFLEFHRELAKKYDPNIDLDTEDGQDEYFTYLYGKEGFGPWNHDQEYGGGSACWGPKLMALGFSPSGGETRAEHIETIEASVGEWGKVIPLTHSGDKMSLDGNGKKYSVLWNGEVEEELPRAVGVEPKNPAVCYNLRLKSRESEAIPIKVKFF